MSDPFSNGDDFLGGGSNAPSLSFTNIGDSATGVVTKIDGKTDTLPDGTVRTWPDGQPMKVWIFTLDTDDGERTLWVRGNMVTAIKKAAAAAGVSTVIGSKLSIQHHELGDKKPGKHPAKLFRAKIEPAPAKPASAPAAAAGGDEW